MTEIQVVVASRIRAIRKRKKLTLKAVSDASGIAISLLSDIENQKRGGSLTTIASIAKALGVTPAYLMREVA